MDASPIIDSLRTDQVRVQIGYHAVEWYEICLLVRLKLQAKRPQGSCFAEGHRKIQAQSAISSKKAAVGSYRRDHLKYGCGIRWDGAGEPFPQNHHTVAIHVGPYHQPNHPVANHNSAAMRKRFCWRAIGTHKHRCPPFPLQGAEPRPCPHRSRRKCSPTVDAWRIGLQMEITRCGIHKPGLFVIPPRLFAAVVQQVERLRHKSQTPKACLHSTCIRAIGSGIEHDNGIHGIPDINAKRSFLAYATSDTGCVTSRWYSFQRRGAIGQANSTELALSSPVVTALDAITRQSK